MSIERRPGPCAGGGRSRRCGRPPGRRGRSPRGADHTGRGRPVDPVAEIEAHAQVGDLALAGQADHAPLRARPPPDGPQHDACAGCITDRVVASPVRRRGTSARMMARGIDAGQARGQPGDDAAGVGADVGLGRGRRARADRWCPAGRDGPGGSADRTVGGVVRIDPPAGSRGSSTGGSSRSVVARRATWARSGRTRHGLARQSANRPDQAEQGEQVRRRSRSRCSRRTAPRACCAGSRPSGWGSPGRARSAPDTCQLGKYDAFTSTGTPTLVTSKEMVSVPLLMFETLVVPDRALARHGARVDPLPVGRARRGQQHVPLGRDRGTS